MARRRPPAPGTWSSRRRCTVRAPAVARLKLNVWEYRPHLDGLRAVAVYLVVLFHAGLSRPRWLHRRRRVLRAVGLPRHPAAAARRWPAPGPRRRSRRFYARRFRRLLPGGVRRRWSSPRSCSPRSPRPSEVADASGVDPGRVPLRRELVLHRPVDRLLRRRRRRPARCCTSGRCRSRSSSTSSGRCLLGAVLAVAAPAPARASGTSCRVGRRRRGAGVASALGAVARDGRPRTAPTTAPTPGPTSCSPARCSRSRPAAAGRRGRSTRRRGRWRVASLDRAGACSCSRPRLARPRRRSSAASPSPCVTRRRSSSRSRRRTGGLVRAGAVVAAGRLPRPDLLRHLPVALARGASCWPASADVQPDSPRRRSRRWWARASPSAQLRVARAARPHHSPAGPAPSRSGAGTGARHQPGGGVDVAPVAARSIRQRSRGGGPGRQGPHRGDRDQDPAGGVPRPVRLRGLPARIRAVHPDGGRREAGDPHRRQPRCGPRPAPDGRREAPRRRARQRAHELLPVAVGAAVPERRS